MELKATYQTLISHPITPPSQHPPPLVSLPPRNPIDHIRRLFFSLFLLVVALPPDGAVDHISGLLLAVVDFVGQISGLSAVDGFNIGTDGKQGRDGGCLSGGEKGDDGEGFGELHVW